MRTRSQSSLSVLIAAVVLFPISLIAAIDHVRGGHDMAKFFFVGLYGAPVVGFALHLVGLFPAGLSSNELTVLYLASICPAGFAISTLFERVTSKC
jgi:hypothetical protein